VVAVWFVLRRTFWIAVTVWVVFTVSFLLMKAVPGGPFDRERALDPAIEALSFALALGLTAGVLSALARGTWLDVSLRLAATVGIARLTRTSMLDVLSQDYIRTAYAKGLPRRRIILVHALRGALLPVVSFLGPAVAGILTGSLVIEEIFFIPGLGVHFVQAALQRDYTLAMGLVLLYTVLICVMNLLVDLAYAVLDPRVKLE